MDEERYHYNNGNIALCEKPACSLEHYSIDQPFVLLRDDTLGDRYRYRLWHMKEVVA